MSLKRVDELRVGQRFTIPGIGLEGKVLHKGVGSVTVLYKDRAQVFKARGEEVRIPRSRRVTIAPTTKVETRTRRKT